jgi:cyclopropane fatty-acyl-phospholipid synthase-like methyltransferase
VKSEILDLAEVTPLTREYVSKAGVAAQVSVRDGDMLHDDFGSGYDLIMLNAICHMFSEEQNRALFRRARKALAPNGRLAVQDFILNPEKTGPLQAALFSVNMLTGTEAGASYSEPEYTAWMRAAGFAEVQRVNLPGPSDLMVGVVK